MRKRLPLLVERALGDVTAHRIESSQRNADIVRQKVLAQGATLSCHKGCNNCCYRPIVISILEGILLFRSLVSRGRWSPALRRKLQEHADLVTNLDPRVWLLSAFPCPLLADTGLCLGYSDRPMVCRTKFSFGSPETCHPHHLLTPPVGTVPDVEVVTAFHEMEERLMKRLGMRLWILPLSKAILLAEKVEQGEEDLATCVSSLLLKELREKA